MMDTFHLQIVTPDGLMFDGAAQRLLVRTTEGDVGILASHADYVSPVATGVARVTTESGDTKAAACSGGLVSVKKGVTRLAADTFEWGEDIDIERARRAKTRAEKMMKSSSDFEERAAVIKLKRALTRISASEHKI